MLPTKFRFIWPNGFRGEESKKSVNQKQESPVVAMFVTNRDGMSNLHRGPSIDASYQVSDHLAKRFQRKRFLEINQYNFEANAVFVISVALKNSFETYPRKVDSSGPLILLIRLHYYRLLLY